MTNLFKNGIAPKVEGKMTDTGTDAVMKIQTIGLVANSILFRFGILILIWRSPDLAELLIKLLLKS